MKKPPRNKRLRACVVLSTCLVTLIWLLSSWFTPFIDSPRPLALGGEQQRIAIKREEEEEDSSIPKSFGLVLLTSVQEQDMRQTERDRVLAALCEKENLDLLVRHQFKLYISVDSAFPNPPTIQIPKVCQSSPLQIQFLTPVPEPTSKTHPFSQTPTGRIARHYKFALAHVFKLHTHVLVLEDDLLPSKDFVSLFVPPSPAFTLLQTTPSRVWCISSWNDMGHKSLATNHERLFRTDFFPGLGWMMTRTMFNKVMLAKWPEAPTTGWDNWLRANNDLDRECIVPEVNRVAHISSRGVNVQSATPYQSFAFSTSQGSTNWKLDDNDDEVVRTAKRIPNLDNLQHEMGNVLVVYDHGQLAKLLSQLGCDVPMKDEPRASRQGLLALRRSPTAFTFLCHRTRCAPWLFPQEQFVKPTRSLHRAKAGENCQVTCTQNGHQCDDVNLQTIAYGGRACAYMRTYFTCPEGCGHQVGSELPAMAINSRVDTEGQCLVGESAVPTCQASHPYTARLCSCV